MGVLELYTARLEEKSLSGKKSLILAACPPTFTKQPSFDASRTPPLFSSAVGSVG
jgi:hypothetical protein